jgi:hypothetical protein
MVGYSDNVFQSIVQSDIETELTSDPSGDIVNVLFVKGCSTVGD